MVMAYVACAHLHTIGDPDLWGHLRFGLDMLETGSIPQTDPYSFTAAGARWINHEWLAELTFALCYSAAGAAGLVWLKITLALATLGVCFRHLRQQDVAPGWALTVLLPWVAIIPNFGVIRPLHFTVPLFAVLLSVFASASEGRQRGLWLLAPLFALWANCHGGFLAGVAVTVIWTAALAVFDRALLKKAWIPVACGVAATFATPYGWELLSFLLRTATVHRPEITEWEPMRATSIGGLLYLGSAAAGVLGLLYSRLPRRAPHIALFSAIAILPFAAVRHVTLATVAVILLAGPHIADALRRLAELTTRPARKEWQIPAWAFVVPLVLTSVLFATVLKEPPSIQVPADKYPVQAVRLLAASGIEGSLLNRFNWGEYILWHLGPKVKVAMDGRRETVYPKGLYEDYLKFQEGKLGWALWVERHRADVALLEPDLVSASLFRLMPEWELVYEDKVSAVFVRKHSTAHTRLLQAIHTLGPAPQTTHFP
jgi:hypothetical protein